jgi:hypothetical protein
MSKQADQMRSKRPPRPPADRGTPSADRAPRLDRGAYPLNG